jgi:hypothetical protein
VEDVGSPESVRAELAYARPEDATPDPERPGLLRAPDADPYAVEKRPVVHHVTDARDCSALADFEPDLVVHGFARADLSRDARLQAALERVRATGRLEKADVAEIRRRLVGHSLPLSGGRRAWVLFVAPEGFLLRTPGPNGMPPVTADGEEALDGARGVHADQDVGGTPLRQIMRGAAPRLFHHDSPDGRNARSPLHLLNVWIPLDQVTRPLALMDGRTLDRPRQQLRLGLKVDALLGRGQARAVNHIWTFLADDAHRWYFASDMDARSAWVFETLGTPHAAIVLPGEDRAEARYRRLGDALAALDAGDAAGLARAASGERDAPAADVPAPLRRAIAEMDAVLDEAAGRADALGRGEGTADWRARAERARSRVVRKSIELRAVALVTRDLKLPGLRRS